MTPVAQMIGANRIVAGGGIVHPVGNNELSPQEERRLRRRLVEQALEALQQPAGEPLVVRAGTTLSAAAEQR